MIKCALQLKLHLIICNNIYGSCQWTSRKPPIPSTAICSHHRSQFSFSFFEMAWSVYEIIHMWTAVAMKVKNEALIFSGFSFPISSIGHDNLLELSFIYHSGTAVHIWIISYNDGCFVKGCPTKAYKRTHQCRKVMVINCRLIKAKGVSVW